MVTMPVDIFPLHRHPGGQRGLELLRHLAGGDGKAHRHRLRAGHDHDGQRYRAHRVAILQRRCRSSALYFQPNVKIDMAVAQVTAICQTLLRILPPGTTPPNVIKYDASAVPILQLGLSSQVLSEQAIARLRPNFIRTQLATVQGASVPQPYGGKYRQVMVDLNPDLMYGERPVGHRCFERPEPAEPDPARGHGEVRRQGVPDQGQQQPAHRSRVQPPAREDRKRRRRLYGRCGAGARRLRGAEPTSCA